MAKKDKFDPATRKIIQNLSKRRRLAKGAGMNTTKRLIEPSWVKLPTPENTPADKGVSICKVEGRNEGTGTRPGGRGPNNVKTVWIGNPMCGSHFYSPAVQLAKAIRDSLNPDKCHFPSAVKRLSDMTPEERAALEARVGAKVKRD